jgi:uncharacterized protein (DUF302 family)
MSYYIARTVSGSFETVVADVVERLKSQGFGVLSGIDAQAKLGVNTPKCRILDACNPVFAHQALQLESKLGVLLPCNVRGRGLVTKKSPVIPSRVTMRVGPRSAPFSTTDPSCG